jgi:beclin 1
MPGLGDQCTVLNSYVVLDQRRGSACATAGALPELVASTPATGSSDMAQAATLHESLRTVSRLLELSELLHEMSPSTACGVPLCSDCGNAIQGELQRRLEEAHAEREMLQAAFAELEAGEEDEDDVLSDADYERERAAQLAEEENLRAAVVAAKAERAALNDELLRLRQQRDAQLAEEEARHAMLNGAELERQGASEEALRAAQLVTQCERELRRLQRVDVLSDVFLIDIDGVVGSINGLRLGRLSTVHVEWAELNAALGQVVLLVVTLARLHGVTFRAHLLVPHGSFSKVYTSAKVAYELYGSGSANLGRLFGTGRFEKGLGMLITCIAELCEYAAARPRAGVPAMPPYPVNDLNGGFIGSAVEGKKLLADLAWVLKWHAQCRAQR